MNIIDIRKITGSKPEIIDFKDEEIIFTKEIEEEGLFYLSINSYHVKKSTIKEIYKYEIPIYEYSSQYISIYGENIIIIKMHYKNKIEVETINKNTKEVQSKQYFHVNGEVTSIPIHINSRYFMFFEDRETIDGRDEYALYLGDLIEDKIYLIKDKRVIDGVSVVHGLLDVMPNFIHNNEEYIIFNETYMDDYEYEAIYDNLKNNQIDKNNFTEGLYFIKLNDFVESIKLAKENIEFEVISEKHLDGWVRYMFMDENNIYFRDKDFTTQIESICKLNKSTLKCTTTTKEINHKEIKGCLRYYHGEVYEEIKKIEEISANDYIQVNGIYNCDYKLKFKNDTNMGFYKFIENRYLIAIQWTEDEEDNYFEYVYVIDTHKDKCIKYDGDCRVYDNVVILYDHSGYF